MACGNGIAMEKDASKEGYGEEVIESGRIEEVRQG